MNTASDSARTAAAYFLNFILYYNALSIRCIFGRLKKRISFKKKLAN
jgi:hypothetical protein